MTHKFFSKPYMDNRQIILVRRGEGKRVRTIGDFVGKRIGTQAGSNSEDYINDDVRLKNSFAEFKTYRTFKDAFAELEAGEVDALIVDELAARYELTNIPPKFDIVEDTIGPITQIAIAFPKDNTKLRDRVQKVFDEMIADGTARKISEHWFKADLIKRVK